MRRFLQFIAGLIGITLLLAFVEFMPAPRYTYFWDRTYDTGHILVFGIGVMMTLTMVRAFGLSQRLRWQYVGSCVFTLILGLLVEVWQSFHERTAEWIDVYSDLVGILAFAAIYAMLDKRIVNPREGLLRRGTLALIAGAILFAGLLPFFQTVSLYVARYRLQPSLIDFEKPWYPHFYYEQSADFEVVDPPDGWPDHAKRFDKVARITLLEKGKYPGLVYREPHWNWSRYESLEWDLLYEATVPREFVVRVHDFDHSREPRDRFRAVVTINPGFQTLRFKLSDIQQTESGRELDLTRIAGLGIFTMNAKDKPVLYLGDLRLVK